MMRFFEIWPHIKIQTSMRGKFYVVVSWVMITIEIKALPGDFEDTPNRLCSLQIFYCRIGIFIGLKERD